MKKIILLFAFVITANFSFGQSLFDKLEDIDEVSSVVITKDAFELIKKFPDAKSEDMEIFNTAKGLNELKVFSTEDSSIASRMESMVNSAIKGSNLTQLMRVKDKGSRVKIYVKATKNKDIVSEVLMFVKNSNKGNKNGKLSSTIISLTGDIDVNKLSKIASKYSDKKK
ncbi:MULTISPECIES: DUF4252 domain-containing protein [unclassified Tenacibaculum]|uniref:DUF4252 domain-containing protein n=1 Tax=unclassified Tenacibaculum TaxID=2635139 RepID=UPI001F1944D7|nr:MULTISPECIES: DUF4252 domain-containing protein [unclassified Tenacibaculum]MCF2875094.1 DUF4252 domain-containing protein [Tenacibaculum sp. Cn5-1]MCF2935170.1 DUF4252 domain-containing protein [Tenacibaculum sp. Cn5-34]MCG7511388.1 DUF4252 domain-containing protein [Tenacibaculum sp. Cn5-46]